jgi:peptidoglycan hydrolase CwlO-like protein
LEIADPDEQKLQELQAQVESKDSEIADLKKQLELKDSENSKLKGERSSHIFSLTF